MSSIKGTKTEKNLLTAFAGESQARNRYDFFAKVAKNEGYEQISAAFTETALQEKEHAKRLFKFLEGGEVEITASYPAGEILSTLENLAAAAEGEHYENTTMYPEFAKIAAEEGFAEIAAAMKSIAVAELAHEEKFRKLADNINGGKVFKRDGKVWWQCRNCGYIIEAASAPAKCPACAHPQAYFELRSNNF